MTWTEDLTSKENDAIEELKKRTINVLTPKMLEDESLFYRFLKARDFDINNAESMLRKHIAWRKEYQVDTILTDYKAPDDLVKYSPNAFLGYDKEGCVVRFIDFGGSDPKGVITAFKKVDIFKFNFQIVEKDLERLKEQSKKLGKPVGKILYIYDWSKLTFAKVTNKKVIEMLLLAAKMYQDNYPETIKFKFQINASVYFTLLFSIIKVVIAAQILEKIKVYGSDGWKEALLELIDADVLPVFLGGTRTDPDGNPYCKSIIQFGREVPESLYPKKSDKRLCLVSGVKKLTVTRFAKSEISFEVNEPGTILEWEFETKSKDIGFCVYFKGKQNGEGKPVALIPKQRIDTCIEPETGMYKCENAGTYIIIFDNSYSWIYPKEIYYRARLIGPTDEGKDEWP